MTVSTQVAESNVRAARNELQRDIARMEKLDGFMRFVQWEIEPRLPEGIVLPRNMYSYSGNSIEIEIPFVAEREWRGLSGTAGLIYKIRKALNIEKLQRNTYTYGERVQNTYYGRGQIGDEEFGVNIRLGDQLPPTCHVEYVEEEKVEKRRVAKVVCN